MQTTYIMTGTVNDDHTLILDEALPISQGKVRVVVEVLPIETRPTLAETLARIHEGQRLRGHLSPSREEVDARIRDERNSWDED